MYRDSIFIEKLNVQARIGVYEWERRIEQTLLIDLNVETDFSAASESDGVEDTISYAWLAEQLTEKVRETHYALLEALIDALSQWLTSLASVQAFELTISKPGAVAKTQSVGVQRRYQRA